MRRTKTVSFGEAWEDFLRSSPTVARKIAEAKVSDCWPSVAGSVVARFTSAIDIKDGTMYVRVTSSVIRNELFMQRASLRDALNRAVGMDVVRVLIIK